MHDSIRLGGGRKRKRHKGISIGTENNLGSREYVFLRSSLVLAFSAEDVRQNGLGNQNAEEKGQIGKQEGGNRETWRRRARTFFFVSFLTESSDALDLVMSSELGRRHRFGSGGRESPATGMAVDGGGGGGERKGRQKFDGGEGMWRWKGKQRLEMGGGGQKVATGWRELLLLRLPLAFVEGKRSLAPPLRP
ncbi:hypothetical protein BHE74_00020730 [Ensete ventricosum]|nr:hypothetical protein BHE74_00020730 [Ensete ventricosum]